MPKTFSVAIVTLNEAANLPRTLASVRLISGIPVEIVIVDSGSTDATLEIARAAGARIFFESWKGFAAQKNSAIDHTTSDWILSLDADEEISSELALEIQLLLEREPSFDAYRIPRLNHFLGYPLRHGGYWPDPKLRLFRRGTALFQQQAVHETMRADGSVGRLKGHLIHHCYPTLGDYNEHMNRYSTIAAQSLVASGHAHRSRFWLFWNSVLNPAATFLYNYVFRLGFLDGRAGFLQHLHHSAYVRSKYEKAFALAQAKSIAS